MPPTFYSSFYPELTYILKRYIIRSTLSIIRSTSGRFTLEALELVRLTFQELYIIRFSRNFTRARDRNIKNELNLLQCIISYWFTIVYIAVDFIKKVHFAVDFSTTRSVC